MFKYLFSLEPRLYERYLTLEKNVKSESASFFDSYIDLLEQYVRYVCGELEIVTASHDTCGMILQKEVLKNFMLSIGVVEYDYEKMKDYSRKINKHKHDKQKSATLEQVINYLNAFYRFSSPYAIYKKIDVPAFSDNYYLELFGVLERENAALKSELKTVDDNVFSRLASLEQGVEEILGHMKNQESEKKMFQAPPDPREARRTILEFISRATQHFHFWGKYSEFSSSKSRILKFLGITALLCIISAVINTCIFGFFCFGDILRIFWLFLSLSILIASGRSQLKTPVSVYYDIAYESLVVDADGIFVNSYEKKFKYKWFPVITVIGSVINILGVIAFTPNAALFVVAFVFEVAFLVLMFVTLHFFYDFFDSYMLICFTGANLQGKEITIVYNYLAKAWFDEEEFARKNADSYDK